MFENRMDDYDRTSLTLEGLSDTATYSSYPARRNRNKLIKIASAGAVLLAGVTAYNYLTATPANSVATTYLNNAKIHAPHAYRAAEQVSAQDVATTIQQAAHIDSVVSKAEAQYEAQEKKGPVEAMVDWTEDQTDEKLDRAKLTELVTELYDGEKVKVTDLETLEGVVGDVETRIGELLRAGKVTKRETDTDSLGDSEGQDEGADENEQPGYFRQLFGQTKHRNGNRKNHGASPMAYVENAIAADQANDHSSATNTPSEKHWAAEIYHESHDEDPTTTAKNLIKADLDSEIQDDSIMQGAVEWVEAEWVKLSEHTSKDDVEAWPQKTAKSFKKFWKEHGEYLEYEVKGKDVQRSTTGTSTSSTTQTDSSSVSTTSPLSTATTTGDSSGPAAPSSSFNTDSATDSTATTTTTSTSASTTPSSTETPEYERVRARRTAAAPIPTKSHYQDAASRAASAAAHQFDDTVKRAITGHGQAIPEPSDERPGNERRSTPPDIPTPSHLAREIEGMNRWRAAGSGPIGRRDQKAAARNAVRARSASAGEDNGRLRDGSAHPVGDVEHEHRGVLEKRLFGRGKASSTAGASSLAPTTTSSSASVASSAAVSGAPTGVAGASSAAPVPSDAAAPAGLRGYNIDPVALGGIAKSFVPPAYQGYIPNVGMNQQGQYPTNNVMRNNMMNGGNNVNNLSGGNMNPTGGNMGNPNGGNINPNGGNMGNPNGGNMGNPNGGNMGSPNGGNMGNPNGGNIGNPNGGNMGNPNGGNMGNPNGGNMGNPNGGNINPNGGSMGNPNGGNMGNNPNGGNMGGNNMGGNTGMNGVQGGPQTGGGYMSPQNQGGAGSSGGSFKRSESQTSPTSEKAPVDESQLAALVLEACGATPESHWSAEMVQYRACATATTETWNRASANPYVQEATNLVGIGRRSGSSGSSPATGSARATVDHHLQTRSPSEQASEGDRSGGLLGSSSDACYSSLRARSVEVQPGLANDAGTEPNVQSTTESGTILPTHNRVSTTNAASAEIDTLSGADAYSAESDASLGAAGLDDTDSLGGSSEPVDPTLSPTLSPDSSSSTTQGTPATDTGRVPSVAAKHRTGVEASPYSDTLGSTDTIPQRTSSSAGISLSEPTTAGSSEGDEYPTSSFPLEGGTPAAVDTGSGDLELGSVEGKMEVDAADGANDPSLGPTGTGETGYSDEASDYGESGLGPMSSKAEVDAEDPTSDYSWEPEASDSGYSDEASDYGESGLGPMSSKAEVDVEDPTSDYPSEPEPSDTRMFPDETTGSGDSGLSPVSNRVKGGAQDGTIDTSSGSSASESGMSLEEPTDPSTTGLNAPQRPSANDRMAMGSAGAATPAVLDTPIPTGEEPVSQGFGSGSSAGSADGIIDPTGATSQPIPATSSAGGSTGALPVTSIPSDTGAGAAVPGVPSMVRRDSGSGRGTANYHNQEHDHMRDAMHTVASEIEPRGIFNKQSPAQKLAATQSKNTLRSNKRLEKDLRRTKVAADVALTEYRVGHPGVSSQDLGLADLTKIENSIHSAILRTQTDIANGATTSNGASQSKRRDGNEDDNLIEPRGLDTDKESVSALPAETGGSLDATSTRTTDTLDTVPASSPSSTTSASTGLAEDSAGLSDPTDPLVDPASSGDLPNPSTRNKAAIAAGAEGSDLPEAVDYGTGAGSREGSGTESSPVGSTGSIGGYDADVDSVDGLARTGTGNSVDLGSEAGVGMTLTPPDSEPSADGLPAEDPTDPDGLSPTYAPGDKIPKTPVKAFATPTDSEDPLTPDSGTGSAASTTGDGTLEPPATLATPASEDSFGLDSGAGLGPYPDSGTGVTPGASNSNDALDSGLGSLDGDDPTTPSRPATMDRVVIGSEAEYPQDSGATDSGTTGGSHASGEDSMFADGETVPDDMLEGPLPTDSSIPAYEDGSLPSGGSGVNRHATSGLSTDESLTGDTAGEYGDTPAGVDPSGLDVGSDLPTDYSVPTTSAEGSLPVTGADARSRLAASGLSTDESVTGETTGEYGDASAAVDESGMDVGGTLPTDSDVPTTSAEDRLSDTGAGTRSRLATGGLSENTGLTDETGGTSAGADLTDTGMGGSSADPYPSVASADERLPSSGFSVNDKVATSGFGEDTGLTGETEDPLAGADPSGLGMGGSDTDPSALGELGGADEGVAGGSGSDFSRKVATGGSSGSTGLTDGAEDGTTGSYPDSVGIDGSGADPTTDMTGGTQGGSAGGDPSSLGIDGSGADPTTLGAPGSSVDGADAGVAGGSGVGANSRVATGAAGAAAGLTGQDPSAGVDPSVTGGSGADPTTSGGTGSGADGADAGFGASSRTGLGSAGADGSVGGAGSGSGASGAGTGLGASAAGAVEGPMGGAGSGSGAGTGPGASAGGASAGGAGAGGAFKRDSGLDSDAAYN